MFYSDEYAGRKRPSSHPRRAVPEDLPQKQQHPKRHRKKKVDPTLISGGHGAPQEVKLFKLDKASTWFGPDRKVNDSNTDGKRHFSSAYMYLTRCIRKALQGDPTRHLFVNLGNDRIDSEVDRDERDLSEERKSIVYRNAHYKTFWQHEGVRALVESKFKVRAQDKKPENSSTPQKVKKRSSTRHPRGTPQKEKPHNTTPKSKKPRRTLEKKVGNMKGAYWSFSKQEHQKVRSDLYAQSRKASGNKDVKGPSGSEIAKEKGRRWKALTDEEKRKYAA